MQPPGAMAAAHRSTASVGSRDRPEVLSEEELSERCGAESRLEQEHRYSDYTESQVDAKQSAVDVEDECVNGGGSGGGGERRSPESRRGCQGVRTRRYFEWAAATRTRPPIFVVLLLLLASMTPGGAGAQEAPRGWHRAQIGAGSQVISAQSLITVTLSPTVDLPIGTRITVRNRSGMNPCHSLSLSLTPFNHTYKPIVVVVVVVVVLNVAIVILLALCISKRFDGIGDQGRISFLPCCPGARHHRQHDPEHVFPPNYRLKFCQILRYKSQACTWASTLPRVHAFFLLYRLPFPLAECMVLS